MSRKKNRGRVSKNSLWSYYNEAVWPNGIAQAGTEATPVYEVWELYDKGILIAGTPERLPVARGFHFNFLALPTLMAALATAVGDNGQLWFQTTIAIVDDGGSSGEAEAAGAGEDEVYSATFDMWMPPSGATGGFTFSERGLLPECLQDPSRNYPLSDALSVMVQAKAYPAIDVAILQAATGMWVGGYFIEWKEMSSAQIGNQLIVQAME